MLSNQLIIEVGLPESIVLFFVYFVLLLLGCRFFFPPNCIRVQVRETRVVCHESDMLSRLEIETRFSTKAPNCMASRE